MSRACDVQLLRLPSKNLRQTLTQLRASRPSVDASDRQAKVNVLKIAVRVISDVDVANHVDEFLNQYPGLGSIPPRHMNS